MSLLHKTEHQQKNSDQLIRLMTPMIAGILACVFCLVSMTWAWFTASVDTPAQTIQSATRSTYVKVYEVSQNVDENGENVENKTLVRPHEDGEKALEMAYLTEDEQIDEDVTVVAAGEPLVWELSSEKEYEIVMTGAGTASKGYCEVKLSQTDSSNSTPQITKYKTAQFEKDQTLTFTYNTGGFSKKEGVTATEWKKSVENTNLQLEIASFWGKPTEDETSNVSLMALGDAEEEEIMILSDGDVVGLAPIPCPEAKAETEILLEGFEIQEGGVISTDEDYKISLTLKEGYEMPTEVIVNIGGVDYVVSMSGAEVSTEAPYYDSQACILTVPSGLLSDGTKVLVKATATQISVEEEKTEEEMSEETIEEETEQTTDNNETQEDNSADTSSDSNVVADNPAKKEEDIEKDSDEPEKNPAGDGGNDDEGDDADNNSTDSSNGDTSSSENEVEDEKADVKLNLSQLTINLEETQIPTNADLVLTLSAKEDMELPESIVITLDKTIRDENIEEEEIEEDKTEYVINTDGKDNPEGFEFDTESGELTISSELLEGVREITIADIQENEETEDDDEKAEITFEVKNLTFDFTDDEIVTDEDVIITFSAGEGYELPETIIITIDDEEYIIYTTEEDSDKNPVGITFDTETGTLTISKDLLEDAEAITITAEGVKKEDEEENPDADKNDEPVDKDNTDNENDAEGGETTDKEPENETDTPTTEDRTETEGGTDTPDTEDKTETEGGTDVEDGENTETTTPETNPDNTTEGENNGEDEGKTETSEPDTEPTTPTTPPAEDNTNIEQGNENEQTEEGEGTTENGTEETTQPTLDDESGLDSETPDNTNEPATETTTSVPAVSEITTPEKKEQDSANTSNDTDISASMPGNNNILNSESQTSDTIIFEKNKKKFLEE